MQINGYEITGEWKASQCGETAVAEKDGRRFFLKKYQTPVAPIDNGTLDAKTFAHNRELFDQFLRIRKTVNSRIRSITGAGGNIVIPADEFELDNHYVEAAEFVEGVVSDDELEDVIRSLSPEVKKLLMQTAAGALASVHKQGIIHSDLKLKNVLLVKNATGNYVAKLIDFDSSYPEDEKPDEIVGDINYYSPELGAYADIEDEEEKAEAGKKLTTKSDIFSLGLIFHFYLSGTLPEPCDLPEKLEKRRAKGKKLYSWAVLNGGAKLSVSPLIKGIKYRSLITDMLSIDPDERPSALDVLIRLKQEEVLFEEPWPEHGIIFDMDRIKSRGFTGLVKKTMGDIRGYELYRADSSAVFFKKDAMLAMKYAKPAGTSSGFSAGSSFTETSRPAVSSKDSTEAPKPVSVSKPLDTGSVTAEEIVPWPEHKISFDMDKIREKGFSGVKQSILGGIHGYTFVRSNGTEQFLRVEMVLVQKMAVKI
ncbi:MAG: hypothetical protein K5770_03430 [Lachnospiraceae bacterium]|nr:hypothetical protein [Lachnospiraceae bacterium]